MFINLPNSYVLAITVYVIGTASPGPSNLAIMSTAMSRGRAHALALAGGVVTGSLVWGVSAALGVSQAVRLSPSTLVAANVLGGTYLLWLGWKAAVASHRAAPVKRAPNRVGAERDLAASYRIGVGMHLTNPKAVLVWSSVIAIALPQGGADGACLRIVFECALLGALIFITYAIAFSSEAAREIYGGVHRYFNAILAILFGCAGVRLLLSSVGVV